MYPCFLRTQPGYILLLCYICLRNTWRTATQNKFKRQNLILLLSPCCFWCHLKPFSHPPLFAGIKVTTFSKGCLIRQSAVVAGPCGCCQACLCTTASAGEIYPVCFGTVATCFSLWADMHLHSVERKTTFSHKEKKRGTAEGTFTASRKDFSLADTNVVCSNLKAPPQLYLNGQVRTVTPAVWLDSNSTSTKRYCTYALALEGIMLLLYMFVSFCVCVCEHVSQFVLQVYPHMHTSMTQSTVHACTVSVCLYVSIYVHTEYHCVHCILFTICKYYSD